MLTNQSQAPETDKHIDFCITDCEKSANAPDNLAVICGKKTLQVVVKEAKRARSLETRLNEAKKKVMEYQFSSSDYDLLKEEHTSLLAQIAVKDEALKMVLNKEKDGYISFLGSGHYYIPKLTTALANSSAAAQEMVENNKRLEFLRQYAELEWIYEQGRNEEDGPIPVLRLSNMNFDFADVNLNEAIDKALATTKQPEGGV